MKDILFYNFKRNQVDLKPFLGQYNIFILCKEGYTIVHQGSLWGPGTKGELFILPRTMGVTDIETWEGADADILLVSDYLLDLYRPKVAWEVKGYKYLAYMTNIFKLKNDLFDEQKIIEEDFNLIKERIGAPNNYLDEEIAGSLLRVLLCDIWRVFFRMVYTEADKGLPSKHFAKFLIGGVQQDCKTQRDVTWYAEKLGITPKYLTEVSKNATGRPVSDWIDYYTARTLRKAMYAEDVSLSELAKEMNFSSLPVFSRYVKRVLGCSPTELRDSVENGDFTRLQRAAVWTYEDEYVSELPKCKLDEDD